MCFCPPKISMKPADMDGVFCNVMPSMQVKTPHGVYGGVKMVTRYPDRTPSLDSQILLFDARNGQTLALIWRRFREHAGISEG